ncbi:MAG: thiamine pyrophosphate-dependent enzyme, partial [Ramlibacter sp.]
HLGVPVVIVVVNNGGYMAVRRGLGQLGGESVRTGQFPGSFIAEPEIDFCRLAAGLGVRAVTVRRADETAGALRWALELGAPALLDVRTTSSAYY